MKYGAMRCIVRIDVEKPRQQHCWEVKIIRPGNSFHQSFSDSKCGGKRAALVAAKKCRDIELKKRPAMTGYDQALVLKPTNKSGIAGVRKTVRVVRRGKKKWSYDVWAATGTPKTGERTNTRYFSVNKLGNKGARLAAIAQRAEWVDSLRKSLGIRRK
jgi:hypothetical protein